MTKAVTAGVSEADRALIGEFVALNRRVFATSTLEKYKYLLGRVAVWVNAAGATLTTATPALLSEYLTEREDKGLAPRSVLDEHKALSALYKWAGKEGEMSTAVNRKGEPMRMDEVIGRVPAPSVKLNSSAAPVRTATEADYKAMIEATQVIRPNPYEAAMSIRNKAIVALLWWCGVRREDIAGMNTDDVKLDEGFVFVRDQKNGTTRNVPIVNDDLYSKLARWMRYRSAMQTAPGHERALFVGIGRSGQKARTRMLPNGVGQMIANLAKAANVNLSSHSFRRGRAEQLVAAGFTDRQIMDLMGWQDNRMPGHYARANGMTIAQDKYRQTFGD